MAKDRGGSKANWDRRKNKRISVTIGWHALRNEGRGGLANHAGYPLGGRPGTVGHHARPCFARYPVGMVSHGARQGRATRLTI
jgi:hypothetical protein